MLTSFPRFGRVGYSCAHEGSSISAHVTLEPGYDGIVTINDRHIGISDTAERLTQALRDDKLTVPEAKVGLLSILGPESDLDTSTQDPEPHFGAERWTALEFFNLMKPLLERGIRENACGGVYRPGIGSIIRKRLKIGDKDGGDL